MIQNVLVLGSGSAGLIAALSLKKKLPRLKVRIVRSPELGVIGVGEGTTPNFPRHLFEYLGIPRKRFYDLAEPTWKLGIRFLWGTRKRFEYTFGNQLDVQQPDLPLPNGFYCDSQFSCVDPPGALMRADKAFPRQADGSPELLPWFAFHVENRKFVAMLESVTREAGVEIIDGQVNGAVRGPGGIEAVHLEDGGRLEADFFIDSSGFHSELLGKALAEPFESFDRTLFCDRAVVGGWERTTEPILPYTTAEQMDAGWAWQIEHEHHVNRGYVYSSQAISDDEAAAEFLRKNPKAPSSPRVVPFRSGCHRRMWVDNVVAVGNAAGFVEPLEATALMLVCSHIRTLITMLQHSSLDPAPSMVDLYNEITRGTWHEVRDFLGLHYKVNQAPATPFWQHCRNETDLSGLGGFMEFYHENGPTGYCHHHLPRTQSEFGLEGYLVMLVGNQVPYRRRHQPSVRELSAWDARRTGLMTRARTSLGVRESLDWIRRPGWSWEGKGTPKAR